MTPEEFSNAKFGAGMKATYNGCEEPREILSVNFEQDLIGINDVEFIQCEKCDASIELITWLRCENCTVYDASGNVVGAEYNKQ